MILLIDNYDSFSYNVFQLVGSVNPDIWVIRNDEMSVDEIRALKPTHIILSPGPGKPKDAGICEDVIRELAGEIPILGICLGHQAICEVFGATVTYAKNLMHGKQSVADLDLDSKLFFGMTKKATVARYHSLAMDPSTVPDCLKVIATTEDGEVMAVQHKDMPVYGVQFHPESVLTTDGIKIIENFLGQKATIANPIGNVISELEQTQRKQKEKKNMVINEAIAKLVRKEDIGYEMAKTVMNEIMSGEAPEASKAAYLTALSMKGETIEEITGSAEEMRNHATRLNTTSDTLEIVGTGGDHSNSFNISTTSSIVIAAAGVPVTKHGNRAASSKSGAADCLEALGVNIMIDPEKNQKVFDEQGICFLFAQKYHSAMRYVGPIRKELGIRTVFNILGPLTNPAFASLQVMGVYSEEMLEPMAQVLSNLGVKKGLVVYGLEKIDEISSCGPTAVCEFENGSFKKYQITPEEMGLTAGKQGDLLGGTGEENAAITRAILSGEKGPKRDAVLMNAGAGLYVAGKAASIKEGVTLAAKLIDDGTALKKLEDFVAATNA